MKWSVIMLFIASLLCTSCIETKIILKGNHIATITKSGSVPNLQFDCDYLTVDKRFKSKLDFKTDYVVVATPCSTCTADPNITNIIEAPTSWKATLHNKYYFPDPDLVLPAKSKPYTKLKFLDSKPVLQGISIPLKIRPSLSNPALNDSFPQNAEANFSIALSGGWKFSLNTWKASKDAFGRNLQQFSLTPGLFLGTGVTELTKTNTRNPRAA